MLIDGSDLRIGGLDHSMSHDFVLYEANTYAGQLDRPIRAATDKR